MTVRLKIRPSTPPKPLLTTPPPLTGDTIYSYNRGGVDFIPNPYPACAVYSPPPGIDYKTLNCQILWCATGPDVRETFSGPDGDYSILSQDCRPANAGGGAGREGAWTLQVTNNPDYDISMAKNKRNALPEPWAGGPPSRKRQAQDDTGFQLVVSSRSVEREGVQITGRLPAGSMYMVQQTDSKSTSVSVSAEVGGGFFEFFSASIGTTVTAEQSTSNTVGISVNIPCENGQSGQVFWYPLYDV